jgi:oligosaccharyltransferase complex subunit alpha (ribophorin I)
MPQSFEEVKIHCQLNKPLLIFSEVEREIEISHWGNIAIREHYKLKNEGASLKDEFDRNKLFPENYELSKEIY